MAKNIDLNDERSQIALQSIQNALDEIHGKVEDLQEKYAFNRSKYRTAYYEKKGSQL